MPYTGANDSALPEYIKKQSGALRARWVALFNTIHAEHGESMAFIVANKWLLRQSQTKKVEETVVAKSLKTRTVTFQLDKTGSFIKKGKNGEEYVSFMLTDTLADSQGESYTPELLQQWADDINSGKVNLVGDFDHAEFDKIIATSVSPDEIESKLKDKKGIAKGIKALFEKGKLWIQAIIDKRYKKILNKNQGVSLEAYIEDSIGDVATKGKLLGFSFMNDLAANPRTQGTIAA